MTNERYMQLNGETDYDLTGDEIKQGWHFCSEFDGLCRNSNEEDFKCDCNGYQNATIEPKSKMTEDRESIAEGDARYYYPKSGTEPK